MLYDVGNSAFVLLSTAVIPIYFGMLAKPESSVVVAWGYAETIASLVLALAMLFLESIADPQGSKKKFLVGTIGTGAIGCAALGFPTDAMAFLVVYVIAVIMLNGSMVFYDAFLVDATTEDRYDQASSNGYAWGYIGSCVPFIVCLAVIFGGGTLHGAFHSPGHEDCLHYHRRLVGAVQHPHHPQRPSDALQGTDAARKPHGTPDDESQFLYNCEATRHRSPSRQ